jgi:hypothetical protein
MKLVEVRWNKEVYWEYRGDQVVSGMLKLKQDGSKSMNVGRDDRCMTGT